VNRVQNDDDHQRPPPPLSSPNVLSTMFPFSIYVYC